MAACVGVAGAADELVRRRLREALIELGMPPNLVLTHDAEIALWAAHPAGSGIVVISGTGAIAFGRNRRGRWARCGGWGWELDDEGSGYWIGRRALRWMLEVADGQRRPDRRLQEALLRHMGIGRPDETPRWLRTGRRMPAELAQVGLVVAEQAEAGSAAARQILSEAAEHLAHMACQVARRLRMARPRIALVGGMAEASGLLVSLFWRAACRMVPGCRVAEARLQPLAGAVVKCWREAGLGVPEGVLQNLAQIEV